MEIGVDTGGTFTDIVLQGQPGHPGEVAHILKVPSTPDDPSRAVVEGIALALESCNASPADVTRVVHGTTVATNAVLERKGATVGLLANRGFADVLEIGRMIRRDLYDLELAVQTPVFLAPAHRRLEIGGRISAEGTEIEPLDEAEVLAVTNELVARGCNAIAVCLLFSFLEPAHERKVRALIAAAYPDLAISLSSDVDPAFREYERTVVTAFDAYTKPVLASYLTGMANQLAARGIAAPLQVMQSRGGVSAASVACERPVRLFLSGPAAGVIGAARAGQELPRPESELITVDIGGTSCDIALITGGEPAIRPEGQVDGHPVRVPMVDVNAIGAGGGSIAWLDGAGSLHVGPHSAGAVPGPACYGNGGSEPTVTDASVVLGLLNPKNFAGGRMQLHPELAAQAITSRIAEPLGLSLEAAAYGIHQVVNAQMAEGMRLVSIRQGFDPRDFALVPLGGAGPVHATALAEELAIDRILVPNNPGVLSAQGLLHAPIEHEMAAGYPCDVDAVDLSVLRETLAKLDEGCAARMAVEGVPAERVAVRYTADVCYVGQSHYLEVPLHPFTDTALESLYRDFIAAHERIFGYATESRARLVNVRSLHRAEQRREPERTASPQADEHAHAVRQPLPGRAIYSGVSGQPVQASVFHRASLSAGQQLEGPAIVEQDDTTLVLTENWRGIVQDNHAIILERTK